MSTKGHVISVKIPDKIYDTIVEMAKDQRRSLRSMVAIILEDRIKALAEANNADA
jgi:hypothetical protein